MGKLKALQTALQAYMLGGDLAITQHTASSKPAQTKKRLDVYRNGYYWRLQEILAIDYPILKKFVGTKEFDRIGRAYIDAYPSRYFSVRVFGQHLSAFLQKENAPAIQVELAALEWALSQAQDAADAAPITFEAMTQIPPENWPYAQFLLHPTVRTLACHYNAPETWQALTHGKRKPKTKQYSEPVTVRVWRFNEECFFAPTNQPEAAMLQACMEQACFGEICGVLCEWLPEEQVAQFAGSVLRTWVAEGMITDIQFVEVEEEEEEETEAE